MSNWNIDSIHLYLQPANKNKCLCDELRQYGADEIRSE